MQCLHPWIGYRRYERWKEGSIPSGGTKISRCSLTGVEGTKPGWGSVLCQRSRASPGNVFVSAAGSRLIGSEPKLRSSILRGDTAGRDGLSSQQVSYASPRRVQRRLPHQHINADDPWRGARFISETVAVRFRSSALEHRLTARQQSLKLPHSGSNPDAPTITGGEFSW